MNGKKKKKKLRNTTASSALQSLAEDTKLSHMSAPWLSPDEWPDPVTAGTGSSGRHLRQNGPVDMPVE
jgi:hypothetical protein